MFFLKIPTYVIANFDMLKFAEHVLDTSPYAAASRSQMRPIMEAVKAIANAKDGVAEMEDAVSTAFKTACEMAPVPKLVLKPVDKQGVPMLDEPGQDVPNSAYEPFYGAVETMTEERPTTAVVDVMLEAKTSADALPESPSTAE